jgi:hypothetical protein
LVSLSLRHGIQIISRSFEDVKHTVATDSVTEYHVENTVEESAVGGNAGHFDNDDYSHAETA